MSLGVGYSIPQILAVLADPIVRKNFAAGTRGLRNSAIPPICPPHEEPIPTPLAGGALRNLRINLLVRRGKPMDGANLFQLGTGLETGAHAEDTLRSPPRSAAYRRTGRPRSSIRTARTISSAVTAGSSRART